jgi:MFS family permease
VHARVKVQESSLTMARPFYQMETPMGSVTSFDTQWDGKYSRPPTDDYSWKGYAHPHLAESALAMSDVPPSPGLPPEPLRVGPTGPTGPPGPPGGPPPDGGVTAWLQVLGGYFLFFNTWGLINAFGVFQTYYSTELLTHKSNSTISWIGTFTSFLLCASPISWGPIFDMGSPRVLVMFGSGCIVFGLLMTSLCHEYWQILLAQGVVCGLGGGALFINATSILPSYFSKKRALVMGLAASGSSLGGVLYPIIFHEVQPRAGFGWAVRLIALIALITLVIPCVVMKPRARPPGVRKVLDISILKELPYNVFNMATFFGFVGQYIPYFFIVDYTLDHNMTMTFYMLIVLNVGSIPGRIIPSLLADKFFNPLLVLATCTGCATLLAFIWIGIRHSTAGLAVWCLAYGFCSGAFVSLQGACVASMTKDLRTIGTRFGINMFAGALGILIGSPVGGAIFPSSWPGCQTFCGIMLLCATLSVIATHIVYEREQRIGSTKLPG